MPAVSASPEPAEAGLLAALIPAHREALIEKMALSAFDQGDCVLRQGDEGNTLYVVRSGRFAVTMRDAEGGSDPEATRLATIEPGQCFGELTFITNRPRSADVIAVENGSECWVLDRNTYELILADNPRLIVGLLTAILTDLGGKLTQISHQYVLTDLP
ncbi:cyclic nucleotide-binding domain-containing protein [Synechococcus sp. RSCCF101]|uniref:cyclic nucleotide-binding domain-containing protein n=1 Tax=Synechococcus sp. RSCCF101 TaxID=2511069 RepID=UPI001245F8DF|nr:cyclic nucleotide-binding domain-containing protein [Synechococcus sp. RSCCF101]QEY32766.1 cyclic nucleotide-binding domain-containing protein [Synechococcus sp. RSCCF101]